MNKQFTYWGFIIAGAILLIIGLVQGRNVLSDTSMTEDQKTRNLIRTNTGVTAGFILLMLGLGFITLTSKKSA